MSKEIEEVAIEFLMRACDQTVACIKYFVKVSDDYPSELMNLEQILGNDPGVAKLVLLTSELEEYKELDVSRRVIKALGTGIAELALTVPSFAYPDTNTLPDNNLPSYDYITSALSITGEWLTLIPNKTHEDISKLLKLNTPEEIWSIVTDVNIRALAVELSVGLNNTGLLSDPYQSSPINELGELVRRSIL